MPQEKWAALLDGPSGTPRLWEIPSGDGSHRVKVPLGNGYEHFEFSEEYVELTGDLIPVYRWCCRTFIAE
jgi:hypothetical protein